LHRAARLWRRRRQHRTADQGDAVPGPRGDGDHAVQARRHGGLAETKGIGRIVWLASAPGHDRPAAREGQAAAVSRGDHLETGSALDRRHDDRAPAHDGAGLPGSRLRLAGQQRGTDDRQ